MTSVLPTGDGTMRAVRTAADQRTHTVVFYNLTKNSQTCSTCLRRTREFVKARTLTFYVVGTEQGLGGSTDIQSTRSSADQWQSFVRVRRRGQVIRRPSRTSAVVGPSPVEGQTGFYVYQHFYPTRPCTYLVRSCSSGLKYRFPQRLYTKIVFIPYRLTLWEIFIRNK